MKMYSVESKCFMGSESILFAGASVHLSGRNFAGCGSEGVKMI